MAKSNGSRKRPPVKTSFKKGNNGRPVGATNKMSRECKEMIADCFEALGGLHGLIEWASANDENRAAFYTRMYVRLLPVNLDIRTHKDVVYHTAAEVKDAFGAAGMTLELIRRLQEREAQQPKMIEHVPVR